MPSVYPVLAGDAHENAQPAYELIAPMVHVTIVSRSNSAACVVFAPSDSMLGEIDYVKAAVVVRHHDPMPTPTKDEMSSSAPSTGLKISVPSQPGTKNAAITSSQP